MFSSRTRILEEKMRSDEIAQHSFAPLPKIKSDLEASSEVSGLPVE